jgi:hypothetical protein
MIRGLDLFREHFADYRKAFVLIGGVACHEWLSMQGLEFRATKDMDMVVFRIAATLPGEAGPAIPEAVREDLRKFLSAFPPENKEQWQAIHAGLETTFGPRKIKPETLIEAIRKYFALE